MNDINYPQKKLNSNFMNHQSLVFNNLNPIAFLLDPDNINPASVHKV